MSHIRFRFRCLVLLLSGLAAVAGGSESRAADASTNKAAVQIRFVDSATGFSVRPDFVEATPLNSDQPKRQLSRAGIKNDGRLGWKLDSGPHTISISAMGYQPMVGAFTVSPDNNFRLEFQLDPVITPREIQPEYVATLHRFNETVFVGYVSDEVSGEPLVDATVRTEPSGVEVKTDTRGYFQIYVPVQTLAEATTTPARLIIAKPGFRSEERQYLELWSEGDWVYRVQLSAGSGTEVVDERSLRRRSQYPIATREETSAQLHQSSAEETTAAESQSVHLASLGGGIVTQQLASVSAHVRIPTNIRVLRGDGVTIDYISLQTYCQRSLPSEWIASWGSTGPGSSGTNCLLAGAVAVRTYAAGYVNSPYAANYDICGSTTCQVYNNTASDSRTTAAVNATANWIMFQPGATRLGYKLTEYSSENNQLGQACGDGFTAPTGGCLYDPVCSGESVNGHGRGMCQWGTARWASGRKMANRTTSDATTNGYPLQNWIWICEHYYPNLVLAQGAPLAIGDDVIVLGASSLSVRQCAGNTITSGSACPQVATKVTGSVGTIIGGPVLVTADGAGYTWWQVDWGDTNGWSVENYLERVSAAPGVPGNPIATAASASLINLSWTDTSGNEIGTYIERAATGAGPWTQLAVVRAGITNYADDNLSANTAYYFRLRTFNQTTTSSYSAVANATTAGIPPVLAPIGNRTIFETTLLTFTNTATAASAGTPLTDFESHSAGTAVMFRAPNFSGSTAAFLSNSPNVAAVSASVPVGNSSARVLNVNWAFTNTAVNPWLRLTTSSAANLPNPVIDLTQPLRFRMWTDKPLYVGLGVREVVVATGTPIGSNGGATGGIEWVGINNSIGGQPQPVRLIAANTWTTLEFNFATEPVRNFASGNGILSTTSGLAVLEHIAFVPGAGNTAYNVYLDDFEQFMPNLLTYSLSNAPTGATIGANSGIFSWTPTEAQGPGVYNLGVVVTDSGTPPQSDSETFSITVNEINSAPSLAPLTDRVVHAGTLVTASNHVSDPDLPANSFSYNLPLAPPTANIDSSGLFSWQTTDADANTTNTVIVQVTDNGVPPLNDSQSFVVTVLSRPVLQQIAISGTNVILSWTAIANQQYRVQAKPNLSDPWSDLSPDVTAAGGTAVRLEPLGDNPKFYRVQVLTP